MYKKLLKGLLIAAIFIGSAASLTSCKDTDEDQFNEMRVENLTLKEKIDLLGQQLDQLKAMQETCCDAVKADLRLLKDRMDAAEAELRNLKANGATKEELEQAEQRLRQYIAEALQNYVTHQELSDKIAETIKTIETAQKAIDEAQDLRMDGMDARIKALEDLSLDASTKIQVLYQWMEDMKNAGLGNPSELKAIIDNLKSEIENLKSQIGGDGYDDTSLKERIAALEEMLKDYSSFKTTMTNMETNWNTFISNFNQYGGWEAFFTKFNKIGSDVENLGASVQSINDSIAKYSQSMVQLNYFIAHKDEITHLLNIANTLATKDEVNSQINNLKQEINNRIDSLNNVLQDQLAKYPTLQQVEEKYNELKALIDANTTNLNQLGQTLQGVKELAEANKASLEAVNNVLEYLNSKVNELSGRIDQLNNRLNRLITGIVVQHMVSPALGVSVVDPFGVDLNVLLALYGNNEAGTRQFPSFGSNAGAYNDELVLTTADRQRIAGAGVTVVQSRQFTYNEALIDDNSNNAGRVYVSVNPSNVDFTGTKWDLATSIDNVSAVQLGQLRHSNHELWHGVSRAQNGFYEADAYLAPGDCGKANIDIEPELKESVKEIIRDRNKGAVINLAKAVVHQVNNKVPAYALRASFTDDGTTTGKPMQVVGNYNIVAACFRPLSFKTGFGLSYENKMRKIGHHDFVFDVWNYINKDDVHVHMTWQNINADDLDVNVMLDSISFTYNENMHIKVQGTVNVNGIDYPFDGYATPESVQKFLDEQAAMFNQHLEGWNAQLNEQIRKAVQTAVDKINEAAQKSIDDMCGKANDRIAEIVDEINQKVNDKLAPWVDRFNKFVDKYDAVRERVGRFLNNPNHYLQPMMFVRGGKLIEILSTREDDPTPIVLGSGDAVTLYATTYNAEIIVPTFLKYIVVTNVFKSDNHAINADNDATCKALLKDADTNGFMNQLIKGRNNRVPLKVSKAGYTYEVAYTALDYRGANSTVKYYVAVINE